MANILIKQQAHCINGGLLGHTPTLYSSWDYIHIVGVA